VTPAMCLPMSGAAAATADCHLQCLLCVHACLHKALDVAKHVYVSDDRQQ